MIEIMLVRCLFNSLSKKAEAKGRPRSWGGLGVAFWFGGEIMGTVVGLLLGLDILPAYGIGLAMAIVGAVTSHVIVGSLPAVVSGDDRAADQQANQAQPYAQGVELSSARR